MAKEKKWLTVEEIEAKAKKKAKRKAIWFFIIMFLLIDVLSLAPYWIRGELVLICISIFYLPLAGISIVLYFVFRNAERKKITQLQSIDYCVEYLPKGEMTEIIPLSYEESQNPGEEKFYAKPKTNEKIEIFMRTDTETKKIEVIKTCYFTQNYKVK